MTGMTGPPEPEEESAAVSFIYGGGVFLRDAATGESHSARYIDPVTRDYVMDEYGRLLGMSYVRQCVQLAVHTERGSAAVQSMGHRLRSLQRITSGFENVVFNVLTEAVAPLVRQGLIAVVGFTAYRVGDGENGLPRGAIYGRFVWRDLAIGKNFEELI